MERAWRSVSRGCLQEYRKNVTDAPGTEDATIALQFLFWKNSLQHLNPFVQIEVIKVPLNHSETIFNNYLVEPNLKAVCNAIDHSKFDWAKIGFFDGEEELVSMTKQLKRKGSFVDHRYIYKADGVVRLQEAHDIEICVVEVSGEYLKQETKKIYFDHHKANYGCLAMLKTIADQYKYASVDVFEQLKIYFVHAADNKIKLWSLSYQDECKLEETLDTIKKIQSSHKDNRKKSRYNSEETPKLLSEIINPSIIKLTGNDHKKGMADLGPFDSPEHD
ncbi:hypothetical protein RMATCC62417_09595 [Rhizopus microsporus]|nr:hypothetical protein RMATCC62417_09595 [Rhizopus microsporus]